MDYKMYFESSKAQGVPYKAAVFMLQHLLKVVTTEEVDALRLQIQDYTYHL